MKPEPIELKGIVFGMQLLELNIERGGKDFGRMFESAICQILIERYQLKWHEVAFAMGVKTQAEINRMKDYHRKHFQTNQTYQNIFNQLK